MNRVISDIVHFFKREKFYGFLFLVVIAICASPWFFSEKTAKEKPKPAPAVQQFKHAEERFQDKIKKADSIQEYFKKHPQFEKVFTGLSFLISLALGIGLILDFLFLFKPGWRNRFEYQPKPLCSVEWKFSMIFKAVILFIAGSALLGAILHWIRRFLLHSEDVNFNILLHTFIMDFMSFAFVLHVVRN